MTSGPQAQAKKTRLLDNCMGLTVFGYDELHLRIAQRTPDRDAIREKGLEWSKKMDKNYKADPAMAPDKILYCNTKVKDRTNQCLKMGWGCHTCRYANDQSYRQNCQREGIPRILWTYTLDTSIAGNQSAIHPQYKRVYPTWKEPDVQRPDGHLECFGMEEHFNEWKQRCREGSEELQTISHDEVANWSIADDNGRWNKLYFEEFTADEDFRKRSANDDPNQGWTPPLMMRMCPELTCLSDEKVKREGRMLLGKCAICHSTEHGTKFCPERPPNKLQYCRICGGQHPAGKLDCPIRPATVNPIPRGSASGNAAHRGRSDRRKPTRNYHDNVDYHRQGPYGPDGGGFYQQDSSSSRPGSNDRTGYTYSQGGSRRSSRSQRSDFFNARSESSSSTGSWQHVYAPGHDTDTDGNVSGHSGPHILDVPGNTTKDFIRCLECSSVYHKSWVDKSPRGDRYISFDCEKCAEDGLRGGQKWTWMPWDRNQWQSRWHYEPRHHLFTKMTFEDRQDRRHSRSRAHSRGPRFP